MPLVTMNEILPAARKAGRGVGAFNVANLETVISVLRAAEQEKSPVIVQVYQRLFGDERASLIGAMVSRWAATSELPIALHLDHGVSVEQVQQAIDVGYTSVMLDSSQLPFEENVALTQEAVKLAHRAGVTIEAEIGHVPFGDGTVKLSTVTEVVKFVEQTGVDALAVSIGTAHGFYKTKPVLDLERARTIGENLEIPMVLHGGSGTPLDQVREAIRCGFAKINVATELQHTFVQSIAGEIDKNGDKFLPVDVYFKPVEEHVCDYVRRKIRDFRGDA